MRPTSYGLEEMTMAEQADVLDTPCRRCARPMGAHVIGHDGYARCRNGEGPRAYTESALPPRLYGPKTPAQHRSYGVPVAGERPAHRCACPDALYPNLPNRIASEIVGERGDHAPHCDACGGWTL